MSRPCFAAATLILTALMGTNWSGYSAQTTQTPTFEVASVKRSVEPNVQLGIRPIVGGRFAATITVEMLMRVAYGYPLALIDSQIAGLPSWAKNDHWEIAATFAGEMGETPGGPAVRLFAMIKALLADRFKLQLREESRPMPIYDLVVDRADRRLGSMLRVSDGMCFTPLPVNGRIDFSRSCGFRRVSPTTSAGRGQTMEEFAARLSGLGDVARIVRDRTNLVGKYDFEIEFSPFNNGAADPAGPTLFSGLKDQLGLALQPATGPVNVLVVDRVEPATPD
jgi:uncharacterized protein (TIGR03435 family)